MRFQKSPRERAFLFWHGLCINKTANIHEEE